MSSEKNVSRPNICCTDAAGYPIQCSHRTAAAPEVVEEPAIGTPDVIDRLEASVRDLRAELAAKLYECPGCAFAYDARHVMPDGSHVCPVCSETALTIELAEAVRLLASEPQRDAAWEAERRAFLAVHDAKVKP